MQSVAGYPATGNVFEPTVKVTHNGVVRDVESVSVDRELPSNLPAAVAGGSGVTAATGSVSWADGQDVSDVAAHPWEAKPFPPKTYDAVTVDAGYGTTMARLLTGFIDGSSGSLADGSVSSGLVDGIDALNRPITIEPLQASMPPLGDLGSNYTYRHIGLSSLYFTNRCLRAAGFFTTPPEATGCVFSAPYVGSVWPDVGTLYKSSSTVNQNPLFYNSPWAMGVQGVDANYFPWTSRAVPVLDRTMQLTAKAHTSHLANHAPSRLTVAWATGTASEEYIRLSVQNNRAVYAQVLVGGVASDVAVMTASAAATADTFSVQVNTAGGVTIYANNGATVTGTFTPSTQMKTTPADRVGVFVPEDTGIVMGGFQVSMTAAATYNHVPNAHLTVPAYFRQLEASPFIDNRTILDVLKEQAEAECAAMWLDEYGVFRWVNRDILVSTPVRDIITPLDDIEDVQWEHNTGSVRHRVDVASKSPAMSISPSYHKKAFQGSGVELMAGESHTEWITPPAGVDWIDVDEDMRAITDPGASDRFNNGYGSFVGMIAVTKAAGAGQGSETNTGQYYWSFDRINAQTWKLWVQVMPTANADLFMLRTPGDGFTTAFWPVRRGFDLPIVRCKAITEWQDVSVSGVNLGPASAPVLEHDAGWWVQNTTELQRLADWLSSQLVTPSPMIRNLQVIPDDRRQLADIVQIEFGSVTLKALIVGISNSLSGVDKQQSLTVRIIEATNGTTYDTFDAAYSTDTYNTFDTAWGAETYNTLDSDPLRKA